MINEYKIAAGRVIVVNGVSKFAVTRLNDASPTEADEFARAVPRMIDALKLVRELASVAKDAAENGSDGRMSSIYRAACDGLEGL